jgi:hypothetical protein
MPSAAVQQHDKSEPRDGRIPAGLFDMPQHGSMESSIIRPQQNAIPTYRCAYASAMPGMPQQRTVFNAADHLRVLPSLELSGDHESKPRFRGIPADLQYMPQHRRVEPVDL